MPLPLNSKDYIHLLLPRELVREFLHDMEHEMEDWTTGAADEFARKVRQQSGLTFREIDRET